MGGGGWIDTVGDYVQQDDVGVGVDIYCSGLCSTG